MSGIDGDTSYLVHTNLTGAYNCLELARRDGAFVVFLSTSRVYPVEPAGRTGAGGGGDPFRAGRRAGAAAGSRRAGISEQFPLEGARTLYGATKLAAELLIEEYRAALGVPAVIDRCGVIAGPWQMGKVDQGVFTHWMLAHHFGNPLSYIGFGGEGKQVRDLLHVTTWSTWSSASCSTPAPGTGAPSTSAAAARSASRCARRPRSASA